MDVLTHLLDIAVHLDAHLLDLAESYGWWVYVALFAIVFCETGLVVTPFLPGDSLLFAAGTLVAMGVLAPVPLVLTLIAAAVIGDAANYAIGRFFGERARRARVINQKHLRSSEAFFERHGGKTIIIARFVPVVRTFAPFTAGMSEMAYRRFAVFNVSGAVLWIVVFVASGWAFGLVPVVRNNITLVMLGIIAISVLPPFIDHAYRKMRRGPGAALRLRKRASSSAS